MCKFLSSVIFRDDMFKFKFFITI